MNSRYILTSGTYLVHASIPKWDSKGDKYYIESGKTKITILPPTPEEVAKRKIDDRVKLELKLANPQEQLRMGSPKLLSVTLTNLTSEEIKITDVLPARDFDIFVTDESGCQLKSKTPPEPSENANTKEGKEFLSTRLPLSPNYGFVFQIDLDSFCEILAPGKYKIAVRGSFPQFYPMMELLHTAPSNVLEINVVK